MALLSPSLLRNPELDSWVRIDAGGTITLSTGKVELGQGLVTAIARLGAEELDVSLDRIRVRTLDTQTGPDEGPTISSLSMLESGNAVRQAAAEAKAYLLELAAAELGTPVAQLRVEDGTVSAPDGASTDYWRLLAGGRFGVEVTGAVDPKPPSERRIVGKPAPRVDLPAIVTGTAAYVHDVAFPGMLHARVVRPPSRAATLETVDVAAAQELPGVVAVVRDGSYLGVVAEREEQAIAAAAALAGTARWDEQPTLPPLERLSEWLREQPTLDFPVVRGVPVAEPVPPIEIPEQAVQTVRATYSRPYTMHGSIGPAAATAVWNEGRLTVWSATQVAYRLRDQLALALGDVDVEDIRVVHVSGPGAYGHNGCDDAAFDAAFLARSVPGRHVAIQWSRSDEHAWEGYGPASVMDLQASVDADGRVVGWNHDIWSNTHNAYGWPGQDGCFLIGSWHRDPPLAAPPPIPSLNYHTMLHRNADPLYTFPGRRIVKRFVPTWPIRTSTLRGLGAFANVFALESFIDEVAEAVERDPLAFRLDYLEDERAREVLATAAELGGWNERVDQCGRGMGLAFAQFKNLQTYVAVLVEVTVDDATAEIRLQRAVIAADAGEIIDPEGLTNQLEGGFVQAASWTLKERVTFDATRITSVDWESYPILTFPEIPEVEVALIDRPGYAILGAGEAVAGPAPAAIANAVYAATGIRVRDLPLTPDRVRAAAAEATLV